jgi:hypothetical protein
MSVLQSLNGTLKFTGPLIAHEEGILITQRKALGSPFEWSLQLFVVFLSQKSSP